MLEKLGIKGYKCLLDVEVELGPFNVLIGPNDSGKSSFLQALRGLGECARKGAWPIPEVAGADVTWTLQSATCHMRAQVRNGEGEGWAATYAMDRGPVQSIPAAIPQGLGRILQTHFAELLSVSAPVTIDANEIAASSPVGSGTLAKLIATRGRGTAAYLAKVALGDRHRDETIQQAMRDVTNGRVAEIVVGEPTEKGERGPEYPMSFRLHDGRVIAARDLSSGLLVYLFFLALVHRDDAPRVLLVEEPENGLHPHRIHEVVSLLRSLNEQGVQIILTTHSPEVLSACEPEEVRVFLRPEPGSGTEVHRLRSDLRERMMRRDTLGGIWAAEGEEGLLEHPKRIPSIVREPAA